MATHDRQPAQNEADEAAADAQVYAESGVDRALIRWMLSLSPAERLQVVQQQLNAIEAMKAKIDPH